MSAYPKLLGSMMEAIVKNDISTAASLYPDKGKFTAREQLAVYVDGYRLRLLEVVNSCYPALSYYLGKAMCDKWIKAYIEATPSRHFNIDKYPIAFADFLKRTCEDAFACEIAQLESAIADVYHGEESIVLQPEWIAQQTPDSLALSVLLPRKASRLLAFTYPVNDYLSAFRADQKPAKLKPQGSWLLVYRHHNQVQRMLLEEAEYKLLSLLAEGKTLEVAIDSKKFSPYAQSDHFYADIMHWFSRWVKEGCLRQI